MFAMGSGESVNFPRSKPLGEARRGLEPGGYGGMRGPEPYAGARSARPGRDLKSGVRGRLRFRS